MFVPRDPRQLPWGEGGATAVALGVTQAPLTAGPPCHQLSWAAHAWLQAAASKHSSLAKTVPWKCKLENV